MDNFNELHDLENAIYFATPSEDDRKDKEKQEIKEEQNSDWGDVHPASGPEPTAPGNAV
ncbi:hypothetical protein [Flavobacterium sp. SM2513]|uniref:hypothetical protein n=1 Tax=Flavobacterium sp. SM2513 TaxID=3424766 RepID=UPI003D7F520C